MFAIKIDLQPADPIGVGKRRYNNAKKVALAEIGEEQKRRHFPEHFLVRGLAKYAMEERSKSYTRRKQRQKGHRKPLVWSGHTRKKARQARVRATSKRVKVPIASGNLSRKVGRSRINLREEMLRTTRPEIRHLAEVGTAVLQRIEF